MTAIPDIASSLGTTPVRMSLAIPVMTSNTLSYADMPSSKLSPTTSLGRLQQQLSVSFGVSLSAVLLCPVTRHGHDLTTARFHKVFVLTAIVPPLSILGFWCLRPEDGAHVSGPERVRCPSTVRNAAGQARFGPGGKACIGGVYRHCEAQRAVPL